jgi:hypothetical protein
MTKGDNLSFFEQIVFQATGTQGNGNLQNHGKERIPFAKYPRVLRQNVVAALEHLERTTKFIGIKEDVGDLLRLYRANNPYGIINPRFVQKMNPLLLNDLARLDAAFVAMHNYQPEDYFSEGTFREGQKRIGKLDRRQNEAIKKYLREHGYLVAKRGAKGNIKESAAKLFLVSVRHIDSLAKEIKNMKE